MIPWLIVDRAPTGSGGELVLARRGDEFSIRVDGAELMNSRQHGSEERLAVLGCERVTASRRPRVLVGGLGMGFTVRAALDVLPPDALVEVAELVPAVVRWNEGPLATLAGEPLRDRRVLVHVGDVRARIEAASPSYDVILLDVDNGPVAMTSPRNRALYGPRGLAALHRALSPGGRLALWSAAVAPKFTDALRAAGFDARIVHTPARQRADGTRRGAQHVIWLADRRSEPLDRARVVVRARRTHER